MLRREHSAQPDALIRADFIRSAAREPSRTRSTNTGVADVYFVPEAPEGMESNWIPTGEDFFLLFRLYGSGPTLFDRSRTLPDIERID